MKRKHYLRTCCLRQSFRYLNHTYRHVLEFGVSKGVTLEAIFNEAGGGFEVFAFDSFLGLPENWIDSDGEMVAEKGQCSREGEPPHLIGVNFFIGWFEDTLPLYLDRAEKIALLHIDSDLYTSARMVLWALNSYIVADTVIVFDEWGYVNHEQKAFFEWVKYFNRQYIFISHKEENPSHIELRKIVKIL